MRLALAFLSLAISACTQGVNPPPARVSDEARIPPPTAGSSIPLPADVTLPLTKSTTALPTGALLVVVARTRVALGADGRALAIPDPTTWVQGLDAKYKNGRAHGLLVKPLADALAQSTMSRAIVAADASVSAAVLLEIVFTLGQAGTSDIVLAARSPSGAPAAVPLYLPRAPTPSPSVMCVLFEDAGYAASDQEHRLAPGCRSAAADENATAIPKRGNDYDDAQLAACTRIVLRAAADPAPSVVLSPRMSTEVPSVIRAIDALRGADGELVPRVALGVHR